MWSTARRRKWAPTPEESPKCRPPPPPRLPKPARERQHHRRIHAAGIGHQHAATLGVAQRICNQVCQHLRHPLRVGVEAEPFLVSPNQAEAESLVGQEFSDGEDFVQGITHAAMNRELFAVRHVLPPEGVTTRANLRQDRGCNAHLKSIHRALDEVEVDEVELEVDTTIRLAPDAGRKDTFFAPEAPKVSSMVTIGMRGKLAA